MKDLFFRKSVAIVLIVSMIFTTSGFATFADSIPDVIATVGGVKMKITITKILLIDIMMIL